MRRCFPVLVLLVLASCSVKEDRSGCPCRLEIIFTGEMAFPEVVLSATAGEALRLSETVRVKESGPVHEILVPRGMVSLSALEKFGQAAETSGLIRIRKGCQADSVYTCHLDVDCRSEAAEARVATKKQFAAIHLRVMSADMGFSPGAKVRVTGNVDAFDPVTSTPQSGEFEYVTELDDGLACTFRVPRQLDSSLQVEITDVYGRPFPFEAGRYIERYGYDWKEDALKDILLDIDFNDSDYAITIADWISGSLDESL